MRKIELTEKVARLMADEDERDEKAVWAERSNADFKL